MAPAAWQFGTAKSTMEKVTISFTPEIRSTLLRALQRLRLLRSPRSRFEDFWNEESGPCFENPKKIVVGRRWVAGARHSHLVRICQRNVRPHVFAIARRGDD